MHTIEFGVFFVFIMTRLFYFINSFFFLVVYCFIWFRFTLLCFVVVAAVVFIRLFLLFEARVCMC